MSTPDPNADLVGFSFPVDTGGKGVVVSTIYWNGDPSPYVLVQTERGYTARVAAQVRRGKELS